MNEARQRQWNKDREDAGQEVADANLKIRQERLKRQRHEENVLRKFDAELQSPDFAFYLKKRNLDLRERWPALPVDRWAEQATLGAMLMDQDAAEHVLRMIRPPHLHYEFHRLVLIAAAKIHKRAKQEKNGDLVDIVTVASELRNQRQLTLLPNPRYLTALLEACPGPANVDAYIKAVIEAARLRFFFQLGEHLSRAALASGADSRQLLNSLRNAATEIELKACVDLDAQFKDYK